MDEQERNKIEIMMKDYELRENYSTISSPRIRYNIMSFALATVGIIISGTLFALTTGNSTDLLLILAVNLMIFLMPGFCFSIITIWLGEEYRMMRVGEYCKDIERKINDKLGKENILNWETFKREKSVKYPEFFVIAVFIGISIAFSIGGIFIMSITITPNLFVKFGSHFLCLVFLDLLFHFVIYMVVYRVFVRKILKIEKSNPK